MTFTTSNATTAESSPAPAITHSSQSGDSSPLAPWRGGRISLACKQCTKCGKEIRPFKTMSEAAWKRQAYCSISCSRKHKNPMHVESVRLAMARRLREIGHRPKMRSGNGCPPTLTELGLLFLLGDGWEWNSLVKTGMGHRSEYPNHYKLDISNTTLMVCIEVDGQSHASRRDQDQKKQALLESLGWRVLRVTSERARELYSTFKSQDTLLTSLGVTSSTTATSSAATSPRCTASSSPSCGATTRQCA